jgi:hypothetical protein
VAGALGGVVAEEGWIIEGIIVAEDDGWDFG